MASQSKGQQKVSYGRCKLKSQKRLFTKNISATTLIEINTSNFKEMSLEGLPQIKLRLISWLFLIFT